MQNYILLRITQQSARITSALEYVKGVLHTANEHVSGNQVTQNSSPNDSRPRAKPPTVFRGAFHDTPKHMEPIEILTAIFTDLFQPQFSRIHVHGQCGGRL